jgi:hypothetical protein
MKYFTIILIAFLSLNIQAQNKTFNPKSSELSTTNEEYNFLTHRLPKSDDKDMLSGYKLEDYYQKSLNEFIFEYKLLINESEQVKAILIIGTKLKKKDDKKRYLCLPINNSQLHQKYLNEVESLGISMNLYLIGLNNLMLSKLLDEKLNN